MNPYAAPKANLEDIPAGKVWRDGKLVRMDGEAVLPARCVMCNKEAKDRVVRTLYWTPATWRYLSIAAPIAIFGGGLVLRIPALLAAIVPLIIVLAIANFFVRRKLKVDMAMCGHHTFWRSVLRGLSIAAMLAFLAALATLTSGDSGLYAFLGLVLLVLGLAFLQSVVGVQAVSLKRMDGPCAWLGGTGKRFREALPEAPR